MFVRLDMEIDVFLHHMDQHYLQEVKHNHLTTVTLGTPLDELLVESAANLIIQNSFCIIISLHFLPEK